MKENFKVYIRDFSAANFYRNIDTRYKIVLLSTFLWGILAHGMASFNHFFYHDDICTLWYRPDLINQGRWMFTLIAYFQRIIFGSPDFLFPILYSFILFLILSFVSYVFIRFLKINNYILCFILAGIICVFPSVATLFGYMGAIPMFSISLLFAVIGSILCCIQTNKYNIWMGVCLLVLSIGIYQAYIPFVLSIFILSLIKKIVENPHTKFYIIIKSAGEYFLFLFCVVFLYFLFVKISLYLTHLSLTDYKGASSYSMNPIDYIYRIPILYEKFLLGDACLSISKRYHIIPVIFLVVYAVYVCWRIFCINRINGITIFVLFLILPFTINFIYFMCPEDIIYSMMLYSYIIIFVVLIWLIEICSKSNCFRQKCLRYIATFLILIVSLVYVRIDNTCYLKANFMQHQAISYFTTLITRIKSVEGYSAEKKVVFINEWNIRDVSAKPISYFNNIYLEPYRNIDEYLNDYVWIRYMNYWCGYTPELADKKEFVNLQEVKKMPSYPDDGSIKIIHNTVVVKLANESILTYW